VADSPIPVVQRGAEALEALLNYEDARARYHLQTLTMGDLTYLAIAADQLARIARDMGRQLWPEGSDR
jgi:hypothetical protein